MVMTDKQGIPLSGLLESAQISEFNLALPTIDSVAVPRRPLHPKRRPEKLCADKGYDAKWLREELRRRHIQPYIPKRRKQGEQEEPAYNERIKPYYQNRWVVERTISWLGWFRRLVIRWERSIVTYQAFFNLACIMICLRRVLQ